MVNDILSELGITFPHVMGKILSYLEPEDLCILSCVSQTTKEIILNDPTARRRREIHLKALQELKQEVGHENWPIKRTTPEVQSENRVALVEVKNTQPTVNNANDIAISNEVSCSRIQENSSSVNNPSVNSSTTTSTNSNVNTLPESTPVNFGANSSLNSTIFSSISSSISSSSNSIVNSSSTTDTFNNDSSASSSSTAIKPTPGGIKVKRRVLDFSGKVPFIISSTPKYNGCKRCHIGDEIDQDSGYFEEMSNKVKKSRKTEATVGSKASKRQLKRL